MGLSPKRGASTSIRGSGGVLIDEGGAVRALVGGHSPGGGPGEPRAGQGH